MITGNDRCPVCSQDNPLPFYSVHKVPVNSCITLQNADDAINFRTGNIDLAFCNRCHFIFNTAFEQDIVEYSFRYQDQQTFSGTFNKFLHKLSDRVINKFKLDKGLVVEIGSGKCDFLKLLCEKSKCRGIGIDPASPQNNKTQHLEILNEWYSKDHSAFMPDLICCRHTLEHIDDVSGFIRLIKGNIQNSDTGIFFEVPNAGNLINALAFEDIYYEHCSYFTRNSLRYLFENNGFSVDAIEYAYDNQYLLLFASPATAKFDINVSNLPTEITESDIGNFSSNVKKKTRYWKKLVRKLQDNDEDIVIWGSGSKCVSFIKATGIDTRNIRIIDINPLKQNTYSPGIDIPVVSPKSISGSDISVVIIMNAVYENEIRVKLSELDVSTNRILALH